MRSLGITGRSSFQPIRSVKAAKSPGVQPKRARSARMAPSTGASATSAPRSMWAMKGAEKAKPGSRQVSAALRAPPSERPATPTGAGDSLRIHARSVRASRSVWRRDSMLRTRSAVQ